MDTQKLTQKSVEAIKTAQKYAIENGNQQLRQEHILLALCEQKDGLIYEMLKKINPSADSLVHDLERAVDELPKVSGSGADPERIYVSAELDAALNEAEKQASMMKDDYTSVEHLMLGILKKPQENIKKLLSGYGINVDSFLGALKEVRGNQRVTTDNPEETYDVLKKYGSDLIELARQQKLDPVIGRDDEIRNVRRITPVLSANRASAKPQLQRVLL